MQALPIACALRRLGHLTAAAVALCGASLHAHDLWIEPSSFAPALGEVVGVRLFVGQDLRGDPLPLNPKLLNAFVVNDARGRRRVVGRPGADPAGMLRVAEPGLQIVGYHSDPNAVELPAEKFNAYLAEEGLEPILALRAHRNETGKIGRERYARCAKSLLLSGVPGETGGDRSLGFPLELVIERNPYTSAAGEEVPVRLTYEGFPLAGALVVALNTSAPHEKQSVRTASDGRVSLRFEAAGMWLVKAVHMDAAPAGTDADWLSYWASLTFETHRSAREAAAN